MLPGFVDAMLTQTTLQPSQKGTKRLVEKYGDRLVCVRYRLDLESGRRHTTVELIEEETELQSRPQAAPSNDHPPLPALSSGQRLGVRVEYCESELREKVKAAGGICRPRQKLWELPYEAVVALGLESRVVASGPGED
jgi:hypothetical protein